MKQRLRIKELLRGELVGQSVCVKGWVRTKRGNKAVSFIALNDGSKSLLITTNLKPHYLARLPQEQALVSSVNL